MERERRRKAVSPLAELLSSLSIFPLVNRSSANPGETHFLLNIQYPFSSPIPFTSLFLTLQPSSLLMAGVFGEEKYWNRGSPEGTFLVQALKESVRGESQFQDKIRGQL